MWEGSTCLWLQCSAWTALGFALEHLGIVFIWLGASLSLLSLLPARRQANPCTGFVSSEVSDSCEFSFFFLFYFLDHPTLVRIPDSCHGNRGSKASSCDWYATEVFPNLTLRLPSLQSFVSTAASIRSPSCFALRWCICSYPSAVT